MNTTTKNLFFLLSAAPMGMGGCVIDLDPFDTSLTTLNNTTETGGDGDGDGDAGDGDGDTGDGDGDAGDGDGDGDGDAGDGDGDGDAGDGDGDAGDGDGDGDGDTCALYGALNGECYGPEYTDYGTQACLEAIAYGEMYYGIECATATEAYYACLSGLSCEDFMMPLVPGCEAEQAAIEAACFG